MQIAICVQFIQRVGVEAIVVSGSSIVCRPLILRGSEPGALNSSWNERMSSRATSLSMNCRERCSPSTSPTASKLVAQVRSFLASVIEQRLTRRRLCARVFHVDAGDQLPRPFNSRGILGDTDKERLPAPH